MYPGIRSEGKGRYRIRVKIRDPHTGKRQQAIRVVEARSAAEAFRIREAIRDEMRTVAVVEAPRMTLGRFATSWLIGKRSEVAPSTMNRYAYALDQLGWLGDMYADAVAPADIVRWRDGLKGAPITKNSHLRVLKTLCMDAKVQLRLPFNPAEGVRGVREERSTEEEDANRLKADELGRVLNKAREIEPHWCALFITLALTGARWGAVSALRWEDVDFDAEEIVFRRAQWRGRLKGLKVGSMRRVPMVPLLADALKEHRRRLLEEQDQDRLASGLVFPSEKGTLLKNGGGVNKPWHRVLKAAGIKRRVTLHGLRRTFNNLSRQVAGEIVTRAMTGHVTDQMTEHYSFVESAEKRAAVASISRLVEDDPGAAGARSGARPGAHEHLGLDKGGTKN